MKVLMAAVFLAGTVLGAQITPGWDPAAAIHEVRDKKSGFVHPGAGLNKDDLLRLARYVREGVEPWKTFYEELTKHDHRFSYKPRVFSRIGENPPPSAIDNPDFDNRCAWDGQSAFCQAILYVIDGDVRHRQYAMDMVRWFPAHIKSGRPHWDSQFRWPNAERWYLMACEMLRYTGPTEGPLAWTEQDTEDVNRFIGYGENLWWGRATFLNQLQFTLGGPMCRAIWKNDRALYDEMVEILTYNKDGPAGECNGSIREMCRLVTTNEVTGAKVKPHVQYSEMGRDIGHPFPGAAALADNLILVRSQGTRVDPVTGQVSTKKNAVDPLVFLGHRFLRGVNQICKYNLGFDIDWTPIAINRKKGEFWTRPSNWGGGRGRIGEGMDLAYGYYRWKRGMDMDRSEETRYFAYANRLRGPDYLYSFLWLPPEAEGKWVDEKIDPGKDGVLTFAAFIQPRIEGVSVVKDKVAGTRYLSSTIKDFIFPMFLRYAKPMAKKGEYVIRYRAEGASAMAIINPEDYQTEFTDPETCEKRRYVERISLPATHMEWVEKKFTLENPPDRNLIKLAFRTRGKRLDLEWIKGP